LLSVLELLDDESDGDEDDESEEDDDDESEEDEELLSLSLYREGRFFFPPLRLSVL
jgi:hypothetical protein